jgi:DNA adenine methylase
MDEQEESSMALIDTLSHEIYAEPFVGMGSVFFRRRSVPKAEDLVGAPRAYWRLVRAFRTEAMT